jgi:hypothetical protein
LQNYATKIIQPLILLSKRSTPLFFSFTYCVQIRPETHEDECAFKLAQKGSIDGQVKYIHICVTIYVVISFLCFHLVSSFDWGIVCFPLSQNKKKETEQYPPLIDAAYRNNIKMTTALIKFGANVNVQNMVWILFVSFFLHA